MLVSHDYSFLGQTLTDVVHMVRRGRAGGGGAGAPPPTDARSVGSDSDDTSAN